MQEIPRGAHGHYGHFMKREVFLFWQCELTKNGLVGLGGERLGFYVETYPILTYS